MPVLIVNQSEVARLLPMGECMDVMARALTTLARGDAVLPLRSMMPLPDGNGLLALMPAYLAKLPAMGVKVISVFPGNLGTEYDSHQGAVLLFDTANGRLLAMMDATEITAIRTAAVSGVATRLLARDDAGDLCMIGSGVQARTHLEAMLIARPIRRVRVWSRNYEHARAFAQRESSRHQIAVEPMAGARDAAAGANIVCVATSSNEPVLMGEWIAPGAHINAVGAAQAHARELDTAAVARSRLFVDRRESALNEAGDFLIPKAEGAIGDDHIQGEIGEVLLRRIPARTSPEDITLFKSLGLAVEDLAAAQFVYARAQERGAGTWVEFGGSRPSAMDPV
jgi:ornithine cyclodeaminase